MIVLGAGGSAYAVAFALLKLGVSRLYIFNRDYNKAILLVKQMKIMFIDVIINAKVLNKSSLLSIKTADVVINCISIGLFHPNKNILETVEFSSNQVVYDLNYDENSTFFLERAKEYGAKTFNGIGMLLYQAISSFEIWTGRTAPKSIMIQAINKNY